MTCNIALSAKRMTYYEFEISMEFLGGENNTVNHAAIGLISSKMSRSCAMQTASGRLPGFSIGGPTDNLPPFKQKLNTTSQKC